MRQLQFTIHIKMPPAPCQKSTQFYCRWHDILVGYSTLRAFIPMHTSKQSTEYGDD